MFKPNTLALTALLGLLTSLGPMSTDMYLPSLPAIGRVLGADTPAVQLTLSIFLVGFATGQIFYGPVSDRLNRKTVLAAGLLLFIVGSALCAAAWSIETLIAARFIQAIGAAGPVVLARAVVRDLYEGNRAGQELSRMGTIMGIVPAVAPVIGAGLEVAFGWRATFMGAVLFGAAAFVLVMRRLPETLPRRLEDPLSIGNILRGYRGLLAERYFRLHAALVSATYGGLFAFISGSSFVLQEHYGVGTVAYGVAFGSCALAYMGGTVLGRRLVVRIGMRRAIAAGAGLLAAGGVTIALAQVVGPRHALEVVLPMMVYMVGLGVAFPLSQAAALMPYPDRAGSASSLIGFLQMSFGALVGIAVGAGVSRSPWALAGAVCVMGLAALAADRMIAGKGIR
ncbi:multidrug effflux MFS transporter [Prosthecomicrobium sp. N25]|uniref:multidrug effflux MFS transporter n=1 Tax=Prosthecomicrobium sp. N25 TaxID=3129254 RepID=UPI00307716F7